MKLLVTATSWACLLFLVWMVRCMRVRSTPTDPAADLLDHLWLLFYEPIHTTSRIWYRIRAIIRTLRTLSNE